MKKKEIRDVYDLIEDDESIVADNFGRLLTSEEMGKYKSEHKDNE